MTYKVLQWGSGFLGKMSIAAIVDHPELDLAGVKVYSPEKVDMDAGVIAGIEPTGVLATDSEEALLASDADCIVYAAQFSPVAKEAIPELCRLLESGKNVVSVAHWPFVHPGSVPTELREPVEAACQKGATTFLNTGVDTGFISEVLVPTLTGSCRQIDHIVVQEILNYGAGYDLTNLPVNLMGFGQPKEAAEAFLNHGAYFAPSLYTMADAVGTTVDKVEVDWELHMAERDYVAKWGNVAKGTVAAMRYWYTGYVGGEPRFKVQHVTRTHEDQAPEWPQGNGYTISVQGEPSWEVYLNAGQGEGRDGLTDAYLATASIAVHAVPAVCDAPPGLITRLEMPLITGAGAMQRPARR